MQDNKITVVICDDEIRILKEMKAFTEKMFARNAYQGKVLPVRNP